ncbi:MAG: glycerol-3-phosphate dehydrogenase/oxidase [Turneriella sp.]|nr:glycerol-3-phosphate dehydrogenase/oxidase [Turneriella sp.]
MKLRSSNIEKLNQQHFDVLVIGGGINGAVSAAALSGQGAKVALIEKKDFASFVSQESSNLAWGGIKYLETFEFGLVRKLCLSRNHLMRHYPSTVQEIRFFTTIEKGFRYPVWLIWLGTWFYWLIGNGYTRPPRLLTRRKIAELEPAIDITNVAGGVEYSDAYFHDNDARFVFSFVRTAMNNGCIAANYVEAKAASWDGQRWQVTAEDKIRQKKLEITATVVVNACGPYADAWNRTAGIETQHEHVFSKGIHLVVPRLSQKHHVLAFFADDGRLFFAIPMGGRTCIGTTDTRVETPETQVTSDDREFVLNNINKRLRLDPPLGVQDIIAERCGVRPLVVKKGSHSDKDWLQLSRKHVIEFEAEKKYLTIFGGKLTDCLNVGEEVSRLVSKMGIPLRFAGRRWYGEPHPSVREEFFHQARLMDLDSYTAPTSSEKLSTRFWRRYGVQALELLEQIRENPAEAELLIEGAEYTRCEIRQAAAREMITKLEDFLRRRSKIALVTRREQIRNSKGLKAACRLFFGKEAEKRWREYFGDTKKGNQKR